MSEMLDAALSYATQGMPIFPCKKTDKAPLVSGGFKVATTDPNQVAAWWEKWPDAMIGMPTGPASGIDVLDIDLHGQDGFAALPDWASLSSIIVRTPSGGAHVWFKSLGIIRNTASDIAPGVDTRGVGGYAIVPPSHSGTGAYRFERCGTEAVGKLPSFPTNLQARLKVDVEPRMPGDEPQAEPALIAKALEAVPNDDLGWEQWNRVAMAAWRATGGAGFAAFDAWSKKSKKHDAGETSKKWSQLSTSPPNQIGAGTIFHLADEASPIWRDVTSEQRAQIERLAALSPIQYDQRRVEIAKTLGIRIGTLDAYVERVRPRPDDDAVKGQGTPMSFSSTDPWHESVAGEKLVADLEAAIKKHVVLTDEQSLAVSLWAIHTHAFEFADHSPRLHVYSPAVRCGKTTLLEIISELVAKPLRTENLSLSVMFRIIEMVHPTLLIDEADAFLKDNEDMRGILNSGHRRGGQYLRIVGEDFEPRAFSVWSPVAIAGIGTLAPTIEDRSITISLRRRLKGETIERLRRNRSHLSVLARRQARWVADNRNALADADPELSDDLGDREQDNWRPLIAIADAISTDLGKRARDAALKISQDDIDDESYAIMCLADVAAIFEVKRKPRLSSQDLLDNLLKLEDRPWPEWKHGKPMTKTSLARLLKPFGIHSKQMKVKDPNPAAPDAAMISVKGYEAEPIREAKTRYVDDERKLDEGDVPDTGFSTS